jgi:hypothetical protein
MPTGNRADAVVLTLEARRSQVAAELLSFMDASRTGSATELLEAMNLRGSEENQAG